MIGHLFDELCQFDAYIDLDLGYGIGLGTATTDDGRPNSIDSPVLAESVITLENGYEPEWVQLAQSYEMRFYLVWAMLVSDHNQAGVPVLGIQMKHRHGGVDFCRFFVLRRPDATSAQVEAAWARADIIGLRASSGLGCTDVDGNPLDRDTAYDLCTQEALDDYNTKMRNRTRSLTRRGGAGILIAAGGGIACVAFPPSCVIAIPIALGGGIGTILDGTDAWSDIDNFGDEYENALRDCCRALQLRQ